LIKHKKKFHSEKNFLIVILDLDLDPVPHSSKMLDPDPHKMYADPKHWFFSLLNAVKRGTYI
jgi:hypothetical protein